MCTACQRKCHTRPSLKLAGSPVSPGFQWESPFPDSAGALCLSIPLLGKIPRFRIPDPGAGSRAGVQDGVAAVGVPRASAECEETGPAVRRG